METIAQNAYVNNLLAQEPEQDNNARKADALLPHNRMQLRPYQIFVKYNVHPLSSQKRFLLKLGTGLGKTLCALLAAKNFIDREQHVTIVTFTPHTFTEEINHFTELGLYLKHNQARIHKFGYIELINNLFTEDSHHGSVIVNKSLLLSFFNGLIIFDEIQNAYNKQSSNIWQRVILLIGKLLQNKTTMLFLSATPLLYSEEIVDLLQILSFNPVYGERDHFDKINNYTEELQIKHQNATVADFINSCVQDIPHIAPSEENIRDVCRGKVCYIPESIGTDMPSLRFHGTPYLSIPNVTIETCESPLHFSAQRLLQIAKVDVHSSRSLSAIKENRQANVETTAFESMKHIQFHYQTGDLQSIADDHLQAQSLESFIYLYEKGDPNTLTWAKNNGVVYNNKQLTGGFLNLKNIHKHSPKFARTLEILLTTNSKSFVYFNRVKVYGTDLICNMLKENGIIEHNEMPTATTLCFKCKHTFQDHSDQSKSTAADRHTFTPYKFFRITGHEGSQYMTPYSIFNSDRNSFGDHIQIIVGSYRVVEGYTFKTVGNVIVLSLPYNAANFIQVIGRAVRNQSHASLPADMRVVTTHVLVNGFKNTKDLSSEALLKDLDAVTREELDYFVKFRDFEKVKQYEKIIHSVAIDVPVYGRIYFQTQDDAFKLGNELKLEPFTLDKDNPQFEPRVVPKPQELFQYNLDSYYIAGGSKDVIANIKLVLMSRFELSPVWPLQHLIESVRKAYVFPSLRNVPEADIKLHILNRRNIHIVGDYVCYLKTADSKSNIFIGTERSQPPDIDFFLPRSKLRVVPFSPNAEDNEVTRLLLQLFKLVAYKLPAVFASIFSGRRLPQVDQACIKTALRHSSEIRTIVSAVFNAHSPKSITDLLPDKYEFAPTFPFCEVHSVTVGDRSATFKSVTNGTCEDCDAYLKRINQLADDKMAIRLVFSFFTHTMLKYRHVYNIPENDPTADNAIGFMNQKHDTLHILQDGRLIPVQFASSLFVNYVFVSYNKYKVMIDHHKKICDKITNEQMTQIITNTGIKPKPNESRKQFCYDLFFHLWDQELIARISFHTDKTIVWRA